MLLVFLLSMGCLFFAQVDIKDVSPVLDIYVPVSFVIENKIMELDENGNFRGGLLTTRFDIAQYIYRTIKTFQLDELTKRLSTLSDAQKEIFAKTAGLEAAYKTYDQRLREIENATVNLQNQIDKLSQELFSQLQKQFLDYIKAQENQLGKIDALTARVDALEKLSSELFKQAQSQQSDLEAISKEQDKHQKSTRRPFTATVHNEDLRGNAQQEVGSALQRSGKLQGLNEERVQRFFKLDRSEDIRIRRKVELHIEEHAERTRITKERVDG